MRSRLTRLTLLAAALFLASSAGAEIYQWKDQNGKTVISDQPPMGQTPAKKISDTGAGDNASSKQPSLADRDMEFRKRQKEAQERAEKEKKETVAADDKKENCQNAREQLRLLESGERIALRDDKGERYYLDDAQRAQETDKAKRFIESQCK